jgi:hypothetical protein
MPTSPIASVNLTSEQVGTLSHAATALAMLDHYLKHGSISDRKMAMEARTQCGKLQELIDQDNARRQMQNLSYPNDI